LNKTGGIPQIVTKNEQNNNNKTKELNTITHIDNNNGYDTKMILNLNNKINNGNSVTIGHTRNG
jgi:hypothetical protein